MKHSCKSKLNFCPLAVICKYVGKILILSENATHSTEKYSYNLHYVHQLTEDSLKQRASLKHMPLSLMALLLLPACRAHLKSELRGITQLASILTFSEALRN